MLEELHPEFRKSLRVAAEEHREGRSGLPHDPPANL